MESRRRAQVFRLGRDNSVATAFSWISAGQSSPLAGQKQRRPETSDAGRKEVMSAGHEMLGGPPEAISARPRNASWPARNDLPVGENRRSHFFTTNADRVDLRRAPRLFRLGCDISSGDAFRLDSRPAEADRRPARSDGRRKQATPHLRNRSPPAKRTRHRPSRKQHRRF